MLPFESLASVSAGDDSLSDEGNLNLNMFTPEKAAGGGETLGVLDGWFNSVGLSDMVTSQG